MAEVYWIHLAEHTDIFSQGYVGFTVRTAADRFKGHLSDARLKKSNYPVHNAINKYGDKIIVETILEGSADYCLSVENSLRPSRCIGWNLDIGGSCGGLGREVSEDSRKKMSEAKIGKKHTPEQCIAKSSYTKGRKHTAESKAKLSAAQTGKKRSEEVKKAKSEAMKGRTLSEDTKAKLSEIKRALPWKYAKNKSIWTRADDVFELFTQGKRAFEVCKELGVDKGTLYILFHRVKSGWNPLEDLEWLAFKDQYNKEQNDFPE